MLARFQDAADRILQKAEVAFDRAGLGFVLGQGSLAHIACAGVAAPAGVMPSPRRRVAAVLAEEERAQVADLMRVRSALY